MRWMVARYRRPALAKPQSRKERHQDFFALPLRLCDFASAGLFKNRRVSSGRTWRSLLMQSFLASDDATLSRLPLPLAQLLRRAHNAKSALERHLTAFYLWEAALKLLGSTCVVEYARLDRRED